MKKFWSTFWKSEIEFLKNATILNSKLLPTFLFVGLAGVALMAYVFLIGFLFAFYNYAWNIIFGQEKTEVTGVNILLTILLWSAISFLVHLGFKIWDVVRFKKFMHKLSPGQPVSAEAVFDFNDGSVDFDHGIINFPSSSFICKSSWAFNGIKRFCKKLNPNIQEQESATP